MSTPLWNKCYFYILVMNLGQCMTYNECVLFSQRRKGVEANHRSHLITPPLQKNFDPSRREMLECLPEKATYVAENIKEALVTLNHFQLIKLIAKKKNKREN